jgi:ribosomal protein S18 acetylase RimI-like enzyme
MGTDGMDIRRCSADELELLVDYVAAHNLSGGHHIGYYGVTPGEIRSSITSLDIPFHEGFLLAYEAETLCGVLGVDYDQAIERAWLYGPIVTMNPWSATADALYASVKSLIPVSIREHEMFVDAANSNCREFAARHEFEQRGEWAIYHKRHDPMSSLPAVDVEEWDDQYADQLETLHTRLFPDSNYTIRYMLDRLNDYNRLLLTTENGTLTGYLFMTFDPDSGEGYIDLIGVNERHQRAGIGRRLMLAGLDRFQRYPTFKQVNLTVDRKNLAALRLYDSLGFIHERDMVAYRRKFT